MSSVHQPSATADGFQDRVAWPCSIMREVASYDRSSGDLAVRLRDLRYPSNLLVPIGATI
jgi:hypothetical protein